VVLLNLMVQLVLKDLVLLVLQTLQDLLLDHLVLEDHSDLKVPADPVVH
jgi:hypothetical protein